MGRLKAFVLTLDGIFALVVFFLALLLTLAFTPHLETPRSLYLKQISQDLLVVLEQRGALDEAMAGNSLAVRDVLRTVPSFLCAQVILVDSGGDELVFSDPSCTVYGSELQTVWGNYYYDGESYGLRLESWYR